MTLYRRIPATLAAATALLAGSAVAVLGTCGPFTDVAADGFCPFVLEIFYLGITTGTTATTYSPDNVVTRLQMAAFLSRTVDRTLQRGSRRAALDRFWTPQNAGSIGLTTVGTGPVMAASDGADVWVSNFMGGTISRVRGSDGRLLETWSGASSPFGILPAMGRILVGGNTAPGLLYRIDPAQPAGAVTSVASLGDNPRGIAFDGAKIWTANIATGGNGSVSIATPGETLPWTVTTVTAGFSTPLGAVYDGAGIWVTDTGRIFKLDVNAAILQTVTVGLGPAYPVFDGANIWVPNSASNTVSVVRVSTGAVLATLTANGLNLPGTAAFDGERILVTNFNTGSVSLWKAADLTALGPFSIGATTSPVGACSDGVRFWIALNSPNQVARF